MLAEHVLLPVAGSLAEADERLAERARGAVDDGGRRLRPTRGSASTRPRAAPTLPASCARASRRRDRSWRSSQRA